MAGFFLIGETKVRPGAYFNIGKNGDVSTTDVINGITAVIFRSDFGPVGYALELSAEEGYESTYGTGGTTDAIRQALDGGAQTIIACRLGSGGTEASITLKNESDKDAVTISTKYPGAKEFSVTIKEKITDPTVKQCVIYSGTKAVETIDFNGGKAQSLVNALSSSRNFIAKTEGEEGETILANTLQSKMNPGTDPTITTEDYSNAFAAVEPYVFNTICVDTEDPSVHLLLAAFVDRIFESGNLTQAVVAEKSSIDIETRMARAAAFNDEKMNYVLNSKVDVAGETLEGYQTAARIAGMIGSVSSRLSLTHTVITGFSDLYERMTNPDVIKAEKKGCIVLSMNTKNQIWIDSAINTLITPPDNKDAGWKKIRRTKTRFELLRRCNEVTDELVGKVDNDPNGRKTIIGQLLEIGSNMIAEGKLVSFNVAESNLYVADGDSCWFVLDVIDKDSAEHIYLFYNFQFSTNAE
ncbi:MAG: phage tail sheath family protein [Roseburia sp.]|nr:phage tail sheath family protein [Roseburia sp.]